MEREFGKEIFKIRLPKLKQINHSCHHRESSTKFRWEHVQSPTFFVLKDNPKVLVFLRTPYMYLYALVVLLLK